MPAEFAHHAIAELARMRFDRSTNIAQPRAGFARRFNPQHQAFIGHIDQPLGLDRRFTGKEHAAGVAMPSIEQRRDIDIDDIAIFQRLFTRNAVANHMVDRSAAAMRIAAIAQRCGHRACVQHHAARKVIDLARGHARLYEFGQLVEDFSGKASCLAHTLKPIGPVQLDRPVAVNGLISIDDLVLVHGAHIAMDAQNCE